MASAVPSRHLLSATGHLGYGLYSPIGDLQGPSQQWTGQLGLAVTPWDFFSARFGLLGDINAYAKDPVERASNSYGEPELAVRAQLPVMSTLFVGAEAEVRIIGAHAPDIDFSAMTPTFRGMVSYNLAKRAWLSAQLGFRWDNSDQALGEPTNLRDGARHTLHASSYNAVELGLAGAYRLDRWELIGEVSADILVGKDGEYDRDPPSFGEGPLNLAVAARYDFTPAWTANGQVSYSPSASPEPYPENVLIATLPRFSLMFGVSARFLDRHPPPRPRAQATVASPPAVAAPPPPPPPPPTGAVSGRVVDEGGRALADVEVFLVQVDEPPIRTFTDAEGHFVFEGVLTGESQVTVKSPGYDALSKGLVVMPDEQSKLDFTLYASVPAGQVRGRVLDMAGAALPAQVTIEPGGLVVPVDAGGGFSLDLAPGKYTVRFVLQGYTTQVRVVRVQDKGVVVLSIALEK